MKKLDFWRSNWFLGVLVALVVLTLWDRDLVQSLERKAYDLGGQATSRTPSDKIAIIAIDKQSIDNIGRWSWARDVYARMIDMCAAAIVNKALAKNPDQHWQDGEMMAKALRLCLQSLSVGTPRHAVPAAPAAQATSS